VSCMWTLWTHILWKSDHEQYFSCLPFLTFFTHHTVAKCCQVNSEARHHVRPRTYQIHISTCHCALLQSPMHSRRCTVVKSILYH
jgi:hypothetical protein